MAATTQFTVCDILNYLDTHTYNKHRAVAMAAGAATAAAEAAEDAARAAAVPAPTELLMRKNKLHLAVSDCVCVCFSK